MKKLNKRYFKARTSLSALTLTLVILMSAFLQTFATTITGDEIKGTLRYDLPTDSTFVLKNVGTGQYLTFGEENTNMYLSSYEYDYQSIQLVQSGERYKLKHNSNDYAAYIIDIEGQLVYHIWTIGTDDHNGVNWQFYKTGTDENGDSIFRIARADINTDINYVMTAYQFGGTGLMYATIYPNDNHNKNQEWILEGLDDGIFLKNDAKFHLPVGETVKLHAFAPVTNWDVHDDSIAEINSSGVLTVKSPGKTTISARTFTGDNVFFNLTATFSNNKYLIANTENKLILEQNNNLSLSYDIGGNTQKWSLNFVEHEANDGFYGNVYSIQTNDGMCLATVMKQIDKDKYKVYTAFEEYNANGYQLWEIEPAGEKSFTIHPFILDDMAIKSVYDDNGRIYRAELDTYTNDNDFKWKIIECTNDITMLGITDTAPHDHRSCFFDVIDNNTVPGKVGANIVVTASISKSECIELIKNSKVFISRSHGNTVSNVSQIYLGNNTTLTGDDLNGQDLQNVELILFVGCYTAGNGSSAQGQYLIETAVNAGAKCAIGFNDEISCSAANLWTEKFMYYYSLGYSPNQINDIIKQNAPEGTELRNVCEAFIIR